MAYIYVITNRINGKRYVGKTTSSIEKRFQEHKYDAYNRQIKNRPLYMAMRKYGIENFSIKQLEECNVDELSLKEMYWINKLDTYRNGYNATLGGDGRVIYNYQELASFYLKVKNIKEVCKKYGCDEHTVSTACKNIGIEIPSPQDIMKTKYNKMVIQCDKENHNIIYNHFNSLMDAASYMVENNLTKCKHSTIRTHISQVCHGKRKSAAGFFWRFV